jgi:hypothetical protein
MKILVKCPDCESPDISYEDWEAQDTICTCLMCCEECDFKAIQYYKADGWERCED